jgi:putative transposase
MPWRGVTVSEQRERFLEDYRLNYYSLSELAERFNISRKTAYKWIDRFESFGKQGFHELSRRPRSCPWQTDTGIAEQLIGLRKAHPSWGPRKLLDLLQRRQPRCSLPAPSTVARILAQQGLVRARGRHRRAHPGCPQTVPQGPNDVWGADYKGQFRLKNGQYCFPLTVSDLATRYLLGCTRKSRWRRPSGILSGYLPPTGCRSGSAATMGCCLPPTPWPGCRNCPCGSSSWGSTRN